MDGETVAYDEPFSNGLMFPGDPSTGDAGEVANCTCVMTVDGEFAAAPALAPGDPLADLQFGTDSIISSQGARLEDAAAKLEGLTYRATDEELAAARDRLAANLETRFQEVFSDPSLHVSVRAPAGADRQILAEGRFKSQFESGQSGGLLDPGVRSTVEDHLFGYATDLPVEERPIYGYLSDSSLENTTLSLNNYGSTEFILNPQVLERTSWTGADSLGTNMVPSPVLGPSALSTDLRIYNDAEGLKSFLAAESDGIRGLQSISGTLYTEAQIHAGLAMDDVASIRLWGSGNDLMEKALTDDGWHVVAEDTSDPLTLPKWKEWARK